MRSSNALFRRRGRHTGVYYLELEHHTGDVTVDVGIEDIDGLQAELDSKADTTDLAAYAPIDSPTFTGTPTAPTPSPGDNDTSLATTAYVTAAVAAGGGGGGQPLDAGLTSLAALTGTGLVEATGTDVFAMRALGVAATTSVPTRADGDARWLLQSSYTASDVLAKLLTVDGSGSTLDADTLDGQSSAAFAQVAVANTFTAGQIIDSATNATPLTLRTTLDTSAIGPYLILDRNSASPAASDFIGSLVWRSNNASAADINFFETYGQTTNVTAGTEAVKIFMRGYDAGAANTTFLTIGPGLLVGAASGGDKGVGTINATAVYEAGTAISAKYQLAGSYQTLDATLTALAGLNATAGLVEQTGTDAFTKRLIGVTNSTDIPTRADADTRYQAAGSYQTLDATLTALAGLNATAGFVEQTGTDAFTKFVVTAAGKAILDDADATAQRATLGLVLGTNVQAYDATLAALAGLDTTAGLVEQTGTDTFAKRALGVAAGTSVPTRADADTRYQAAGSYQTLDATLTALAGLNTTAGLVEQTGTDAFTKRAIGAAAATDILTRADGDTRYLEAATTNTVAGNIIYSINPFQIVADTADAADTKAVSIAGGGSAANTRGAYLQLYGNEHASVGAATLSTGGTAALSLLTAGGVLCGAPTGGAKGNGTLNAVAVYDDNVILTCMPLQPEFREEGRVDTAKWDALSPTGHHPAAHIFAALLNSGFDPRSLESYRARAEADGALPGMPTLKDWQHGEIPVGEMVTRLWLAVEMLATAVMATPKSKDVP